MWFPFLDWDLVSFVLALPVQYWPGPQHHGRIHREALRTELPEAIYTRKTKAEFTPALARRVRVQLDTISDLLDGATWLAGRWVDQRKARSLRDQFVRDPKGTFETSYGLWAIASTEAWLRRILM